MAVQQKGCEEEVLYAQVESFLERKEYQRKGRCIRFTAVRAASVPAVIGEAGIATLTVDLSYWEFCYSIFGNQWVTQAVRDRIDSGQIGGENKPPLWFELRVQWDTSRAHGYAYATFSEDSPRYFSLMGCIPIAPPRFASDHAIIARLGVTATAPHAILEKEFGTGDEWTFWAYHVGQGMCSLLTDGQKHGILLDAGAGTPVVRPNYLSKTSPIKNDLIARLKPLEYVDVVLSHADADHWRLLAWDRELRDKIGNIYVPDAAKSLALKDAAVIKKVRESKGFTYRLTGGGTLQVLRSQPAKPSDNTECLVSLYHDSELRHIVLQSGDYVYEDMEGDTNPFIRSLRSKSYSAIVVPHHGDAASAEKVFAAKFENKSIAFFSAGNHQHYQHPTEASRSAHQGAKFEPVWNKDIAYILEKRLAPLMAKAEKASV